MNTFFINKRRTVLIRRAVNLLILSTVAVGLFSVSQKSFAAPLNNPEVSTRSANSFRVFCHFYYHDGQDPTPEQDTQACQRKSKAFGKLLTRLVGSNANLWPAQNSLHDLARNNLMKVQSQQGFFNAITDSGLRALISRNNDPDFLPTLWDYNSTYDNTSTVVVKPNKYSNIMNCQNISILDLRSINACQVANNYCEINSTNCPDRGDTTDCNGDTSNNCQVYIVEPGLRNRCSDTNDWKVTGGSNSKALKDYKARTTGSSSDNCHEAFWFSPAPERASCQISLWIPRSNAKARVNFALLSKSAGVVTQLQRPINESDPRVQNSWVTIPPDGGVSMKPANPNDFVYFSDATGNRRSITISVAKFVCTTQ